MSDRPPADDEATAPQPEVAELEPLAAEESAHDAVPPAEPVDPATEVRRLVRLSRRLIVVCMALGSLAIVLGVVAAAFYGRMSSERDDRNDVELVAGQFSEALLTYDYRNLDEMRERVLSFSTGRFRNEYEQAANALETIISQTEGRATGTATDVFISDIEDVNANAIVVVDAVARGRENSRRTVASYLRLDLVKVEGRWRVDGVTNLNFGEQQRTASPPTTATPPPP